MKEYIERSVLIEIIKEELSFCEDKDPEKTPILYGCELGLRSAKSFVEAVSAADVVEVKRGRWRIAERVKTSGTVIVECSECDAIFEISMITFGLNYNFCPNCGCRMEDE